MKILLAKIFVALGLISVFKGLAGHIDVHAKESSSSSAASNCGSSMGGGRSGGCGKSG